MKLLIFSRFLRTIILIAYGIYEEISSIVVWKQHILLKVLTNIMKKDENELDSTYLKASKQ